LYLAVDSTKCSATKFTISYGDNQFCAGNCYNSQNLVDKSDYKCSYIKKIYIKSEDLSKCESK
jgi:hypothetical protein